MKRQVWRTAKGVQPKACNHARGNLKSLSESFYLGDLSGCLLECRKCRVRKQYRVSGSGRYTLIRVVAIELVEAA